jgi:hypothetical protein
MSAHRTSNAAVLGRTLRRLRRDGRLDVVGEVLATLAGTSAELVDAVCADDSDVAVYARAACVRTHAALIAQLSAGIGPLRVDDDPWERIARELDAGTSYMLSEVGGDSDDVAGPRAS